MLLVSAPSNPRAGPSLSEQLRLPVLKVKVKLNLKAPHCSVLLRTSPEPQAVFSDRQINNSQQYPAVSLETQQRTTRLNRAHNKEVCLAALPIMLNLVSSETQTHRPLRTRGACLVRNLWEVSSDRPLSQVRGRRDHCLVNNLLNSRRLARPSGQEACSVDRISKISRTNLLQDQVCLVRPINRLRIKVKTVSLDLPLAGSLELPLSHNLRTASSPRRRSL